MRALFGVLGLWDCEFLFVRFVSVACVSLSLVCEIGLESSCNRYH